MLLPLLAAADNEHIVTVTPDLSVQACKNASISLANVAWYVLHAVQTAESECIAELPFISALFIHCISISANLIKKRKETSNKKILTKMEEI